MSSWFRVLNADGSEPDLEQIALKEKWAEGLTYCDMEGFALQWDGTLILCDECGVFRYPPEGRFLGRGDEESQGAMITGIIAAVAAAVAGVLGWIVMTLRKDQGRMELDAEIARKDALLQKQMAAVPRPSETEAFKRLDDGTA